MSPFMVLVPPLLFPFSGLPLLLFLFSFAFLSLFDEPFLIWFLGWLVFCALDNSRRSSSPPPPFPSPFSLSLFLSLFSSFPLLSLCHASIYAFLCRVRVTMVALLLDAFCAVFHWRPRRRILGKASRQVRVSSSLPSISSTYLFSSFSPPPKTQSRWSQVRVTKFPKYLNCWHIRRNVLREISLGLRINLLL